MLHLEIYKICSNSLSQFFVRLQGYSICNLLHLLKINEVKEPLHAIRAILQYQRLEPILAHLYEHFFHERFQDYIWAS